MQQFLYFLIISCLFISCDGGVSTDKLASEVKNDINVQLQKRASNAGISLAITSFDLIHKEGKEYSGILKTIEGGEEYTYQVEVTVDGDKYIWKIVE